MARAERAMVMATKRARAARAMVAVTKRARKSATTGTMSTLIMRVAGEKRQQQW
jgi:hypothetical protein